MADLIADTPFTYCLVRNEFLYNQQSGHGDYTEACIFGFVALEGRVPHFTVMLRNGAMWARLPVHAFCFEPCEPRPVTELCFWDCLGYQPSVHAYRYLETLVADLWPRGKQPFSERGEYLFTVDWSRSDYSELPDQHKQHHFFRLDSGHLATFPGNRIRWNEPSWIKPFAEIPAYRVNTHEWVSERLIPLKDGELVAYESDPAKPASAGDGHKP